MENIQTLASGLKGKIKALEKVVKDQFQNLDEQALNYKAHPEKWSIAEYIEHLNRYNAYYNPEIEHSIKHGKSTQKTDFQSSWLGKYCINMVKNNPKKQKTLKHMNPANSQVDTAVLSLFLQNQEQLIDLIDKSTQVDWTKSKVRIEFAPFLKLRLGDALQFVVYHQERHIQQAQNILKNYAENIG